MTIEVDKKEVCLLLLAIQKADKSKAKAIMQSTCKKLKHSIVMPKD